MKVLLLGKNGQVGWELQRSLAPLGEVVALGRDDLDLSRMDEVERLVGDTAADVIVNAGAYTAVDEAERDSALAMQINGELVKVLARLAARSGAWLLHYSSDYVFDGTKPSPYHEDDQPAPQNAYGLSKLAGENAVRASGCKHLLVRASWLHGPRRRNFVRTILRLAQEKTEIGVVMDQVGAPTSVELIADVSAIMVRDALAGKAQSGTYHLAASGATSWYDYARYVVDIARHKGAPTRLGSDGIKPLTTDQYPSPARRPANSLLDTTLIRNSFGLELPDWRAGTDRTIEELLEKTP